MMTPTNKNLDFLSNENLVTILRSLLDEIDLAVNSGAHRSTTYLAVSAIEGLFGEILKLKGILPSRTVIPTSWPTDKRCQPKPGEFASLLVSERPVGDFREVKFSVIVPPNAIFNLVYSYYSRDRFKAARIEGRVREDGRGLDNGRLICTKWRVWAIDAPYTAQSEPGPSKHEHSVHLVLDPPGSFALYVDGVSLVLERGIGWEFDPAAKLGFMTEWGAISIADLQVTPC